MFERIKFDTAAPISISVEITLGDYVSLKGRIAAPGAHDLAEAMNAPGLFVDFESFEGERLLVAKSAITTIKSLNAPPRPASLQVRDLEAFDPRAVLGVDEKTPWQDVRRSYLSLAKTYHPDRFAGTELPAEVRDYLAAMTRRINAAYAALEPSPSQQTGKPAPVRKAEAAYASVTR